ncbi:uncharacterized protein N7458_001904 [Penicillium daleae]|uniref:Uncharacterized protein n=1 Tax=Penicillium daleae TaxID=63821 RepID=A0AAD6CE54_9EURO|nr:uncharacterized protein N7458_001904 [Penicillium daleae]KAJ5460352.1 hypothetical protein N7458_001904 [Penicillium daleae]
MHSQSYNSDTYPKRSLSQTSTTTCSSRSTQRSDEKKRSRNLSNPLASKLFRPGSKSPTPIEIPKQHKRQSSATPGPNVSPGYFPQSPKQEYITKRASTPTRKSSDDYRRYSGTVNHCGRHSNDWLFGGFSVRETVRDGIEKFRHHDKES